jgi:hypothetical protein
MSEHFTLKNLFSRQKEFVRRRLAYVPKNPPHINPRSQEWLDGVRNAAAVEEEPQIIEEEVEIHRQKTFLKSLSEPPFDNRTDTGSRGKSVISEPAVIEHTNNLYRHLGLENVKSPGGRGGAGAAGHKLHFRGAEIARDGENEAELRQALAVLQEIQDKATGKVALRIKRDIKKISKVLNP